MTSDPEDPPPSPGPVRFWPEHAADEAGAHLTQRCGGCGLEWRIHPALAGYRLRCECGAWVAAPAPPGGEVALLREALELGSREETTDLAVRGHESLLPVRDTSRDVIPTNAIVAPGTLEHASARSRRRWIDRGIVELVLIMLAFLGPATVAHFAFAGSERALLLPLADVVAGLLVLLIGLGSARYAFGGLKRAEGLHFVEAIAVALGAVMLAFGWLQLLESAGFDTDWLGTLVVELGLLLSLFTIGVCPAVFEELAFRGIVQGRLTALLGRGTGICATGTAFGLAHGITAGLPFHIGLGIYLCWLRERSDSLLPGMVTHFLYNAILVVGCHQAALA